MVSIIPSGAGSVAVSARPPLPKTVSTSGKLLMILSVFCVRALLWSTLMPKGVTGMYMNVCSLSIGMNSQCSFW